MNLQVKVELRRARLRERTSTLREHMEASTGGMPHMAQRCW